MHALLHQLHIPAVHALLTPRARTCRRRAELQQKKVLFRGTFGTQQPGCFANLLDVVPKNAANTNVLLWADKCWALFEAGQPHRLDPYTLETVGLDLLGGHLRAGVPFTLGSSRLDKLAGMFCIAYV